MTLNLKAATASALALTRDPAAGTASAETTLRLSTYVNEAGIRYAGLPISPTWSPKRPAARSRSRCFFGHAAWQIGGRRLREGRCVRYQLDRCRQPPCHAVTSVYPAEVSLEDQTELAFVLREDALPKVTMLTDRPRPEARRFFGILNHLRMLGVGGLTWQGFREVIFSTMWTMAYLGLLLSAGVLFGFVLTYHRVPHPFTELILSFDLSPYTVLAIVVVFYIITMAFSVRTLPDGLNLYVIRAIGRAKVTIGDVIMGCLRFVGAMILLIMAPRRGGVAAGAAARMPGPPYLRGGPSAAGRDRRPGQPAGGNGRAGPPHCPRLCMPTLVPWGDNDKSYRWPQIHTLWSNIADARLSVVLGASYAVHLENPGFFHAILADFLTET